MSKLTDFVEKCVYLGVEDGLPDDIIIRYFLETL
jgi:hypothetical protein